MIGLPKEYAIDLTAPPLKYHMRRFDQLHNSLIAATWYLSATGSLSFPQPDMPEHCFDDFWMVYDADYIHRFFSRVAGEPFTLIDFLNQPRPRLN